MVAPGATLTIADLTLRGGMANGDGTGLGGGAILNLGTTTLRSSAVQNNASGTDGGGISNRLGTLTITGSTIDSNVAENSGGGLRNAGGGVAIEGTSITSNTSVSAGNFGRGGGIANHGLLSDATMTMSGGVVSANLTSGIGGGGIDNATGPGLVADLTVTGVTISNNTAAGSDHTTGLGGGVQNSLFRGVTTGAVRLTIRDSAIRQNSAVNGGGISSAFDLVGPREIHLQLTSSEVSDNLASGNGFQMGNGGGIYVLNGTAVVANTTISGNRAIGTGSPISGLGGGIANMGLSGGTGAVALINATIARNQAGSGGALFVAPFNGTATAEFTNSLVAGHTGAACGSSGGLITSLGHNLEDGNTCSFAHPSDLPNTTAVGLGALFSTGGAVRTHALLPGSPAIDAGDNLACDQPPVQGVDARGVVRPQGSACDIGAYEADWSPASLTLSTAFRFNDGQQGTGSLWLMSDGRSVNQDGVTGVWSLPSPGILAVRLDGNPRTLWLGRFTTSSQISGAVLGLDGSTLRGNWSGTVVANP
jgi:hypothetical protein